MAKTPASTPAPKEAAPEQAAPPVPPPAPELQPTSAEATPEQEDSDEVTSLTLPNYGDGKPPAWLWVEEGKIEVTVTIYAYKDPENGRLRAISQEPSTALRVLKLIEYPIESIWTLPSKSQLDDYKDKAATLDRVMLRTLIDRSKVQEEVVKHHLRELKVHAPAEEGQEPHLIRLKRDKRGRLTEETLEMIKKIHPTVWDLLWASFTEEASLIL